MFVETENQSPGWTKNSQSISHKKYKEGFPENHEDKKFFVRTRGGELLLVTVSEKENGEKYWVKRGGQEISESAVAGWCEVCSDGESF